MFQNYSVITKVTGTVHRPTTLQITENKRIGLTVSQSQTRSLSLKV